MSDPALHPCVLGPYGENDALLEKLVVEFLRDHVYWRRNFHPEDPPAIPTHAAQAPCFMAFEARLRRELHALSAALKRSVPFHSPRYLGHMVSDLLIPGLAAQMLTLPYNPNNVSEEAGPVTIELELKVGLQLARMLGYPSDPVRRDCAFGHLTSGGTLANYQALRLALAMKAFPVALRAARVPLSEVPQDDWQAFNLSHDATIALLARYQDWLAELPPGDARHWRERIVEERIETLGLLGFFARHPQLKPPVVFAPVTAHYSWSKGLKLVGLGREALRLVPEAGMRTDPTALGELLDAALRERQPVLMSVGVLGSTEFGTIDPIDALVDARDRMQARGLGHWVHVDAAWGGYLATLFREPDGGLRPLADLRADYAGFPSDSVYAAFAALPRTDSVTIDPHKLGYIPYGAGAFVCRNHHAIGLLDESADYVFAAAGGDDFFARHRALGRFIPEGSKAGAAAAAVYVTHQVLPLDHAHFGLLQRQTIHSAEAFRAELACFAAAQAHRVRVREPYPADCNLVCVALNPVGNRDVATMNRYVRTLYDQIRSDPGAPLQLREFFASSTTLDPQLLGPTDTARVLAELDLDPATLDPDDTDADRLVILRHTLMNPWLIDRENGISYLARYFDFLARRL
ncbi:MAG: pyridoxal-dependent decarboxylase [Xanthomonadales bacterium]|nr:pyridoxal-dependent decarboxylase [Xanthomonadales bacterium]